MGRKPKIAIVSLTSCEGCQFILLDLGKRFFDFLKKIELLDFSLIEEKPFPKGKIDVIFIEGNPLTDADVKLLKKMRKKAKFLVVLGNCAALGGISEMKNYQKKEKTIRFIYRKLKNIVNPEIKEVDNFVKVDFVIPGCPINGDEFLKSAEELIKGKIPEVCQSPVCTECKLRGRPVCFLTKKEICLGIISLAGCEAVCTNNQIPCLGCRGLIKGANIKSLLAVLKQFHSQEEINDNLEIFGIRDDVEEEKNL